MHDSKFLNSDKIFLIDENNAAVTYAELNEFSKSFGFIRPNELSILLVENDLVSYQLYIGLIIARKPFLILDKNLPSPYFHKFVSDFSPTHIFSSSTFLSSKSKNNFQYRLIKSSDRFKVNPHIGLIIPTSGSTGDQKSVMLSYKALESNARNIADYLNLNSKDVSITNLPLNYAYGISIVNSHFLKGGRILVTNLSIIQKGFWELFDKFEITNFNGVPYTYEMLVRMSFMIFQSKKFRFFTQAGGHLDQKIKQKFLDFCVQNKKEIFIMYGQTEASPRIAYLPLTSFPNKINSIGKSIPNGRIFLKSGNDILNKIQEEGELCYEGENIFMGYANSCKELNPDQEINALCTGDIAYRDAEGFYFITGRKSRFTKIEGRRISLDSLQHELAKLLGKQIVCVEKSGKIVIASEVEILIDGEFKKFMKNLNIRCKDYQMILIKEIPRNNAGKIKYNNI
ncbi:AMP-binding protein [Akkermansiaceae bacterium]|nr:AMP-binding protein [Akkermansiaceae bacterium]